jgi:hypothetical protein
VLVTKGNWCADVAAAAAGVHRKAPWLRSGVINDLAWLKIVRLISSFLSFNRSRSADKKGSESRTDATNLEFRSWSV